MADTAVTMWGMGRASSSTHHSPGATTPILGELPLDELPTTGCYHWMSYHWLLPLDELPMDELPNPPNLWATNCLLKWGEKWMPHPKCPLLTWMVAVGEVDEYADEEVDEKVVDWEGWGWGGWGGERGEVKSGCCIPSAPCTTGQFEAGGNFRWKKWVGGAIIILPPTTPHQLSPGWSSSYHCVGNYEYSYERIEIFFKTLPFQLDHMIEWEKFLSPSSPSN